MFLKYYDTSGIWIYEPDDICYYNWGYAQDKDAVLKFKF